MATLHDLIAQKQAIERQIEQAKKEGRGSALARARALMSEYGLTLADLQKTARKKGPLRPTGKVAAKFRNSSTGEAWSGRGLQPRWLRSAIANGKTIGEFAV